MPYIPLSFKNEKYINSYEAIALHSDNRLLKYCMKVTSRCLRTINLFLRIELGTNVFYIAVKYRM